jgi:hypothetical protein
MIIISQKMIIIIVTAVETSNLTYFFYVLRVYLKSIGYVCIAWIASQNQSQSYITTDGRSVSLEIKHPSWAYDQIFITVKQLRVC